MVLRPRRRWVVVAAIGVVVALGVALAWPHVQVYAGTAPPTQFDEALTPRPASPGSSVLGVAHNAGNNAGTTAAALAHGSAVVEIDVISVDGRLVAGRVQPWRWLADRVFRGPTLEQAWTAASAAAVVKLDLQENDRPLLDRLVAFLATQPSSRRVMVSTRDVPALVYLRPRLPHAQLLFSPASPEAIRQLRTDTGLMHAIDGISAFQGLVDASLVTWAHERHLVVLAWTVNDGRRLGQLLALGVDGVTTQNLAVLALLAASR